MTTAKLFEVAAKLSPIADAFTEVLVQLDELITQDSHHHVVHCLRKVGQKLELGIRERDSTVDSSDFIV